MRLKISLVTAVAVFVAMGYVPVAMGQAAPERVAKAVAARPVAAAQAAKSEEETAVPNTPSQQGIKVHGHWVLTVRDAQGNIVEHRDFENSLLPLGQTTLISLMIGSVTPGYFQIAAQETSSSGGITATGLAFPAAAGALYPNCGGVHESCGANLTVTPIVSTDSTGSFTPYNYFSGLKLEGSFKAVQGYPIDRVQTSLYGCGVAGNTRSVPPTAITTYSPSTCPAALNANGTSAGDGSPYFSVLTGTSITPLFLETGQTLDITVTLSFS